MFRREIRDALFASPQTAHTSVEHRKDLLFETGQIVHAYETVATCIVPFLVYASKALRYNTITLYCTLYRNSAFEYKI